MAAFHGRQGSVYVDVSAGANGNAVSLALLNSWNFNGTRDKVEVTSFGDSTRTYVVGLADASIEFSGFVDDSSLNIYTIADGKARKFYLYNDQTRTSPVPAGAGYWYGTMYFDVSSTGSTTDAVKVAVKGSAASSVTRL